MQIRKQYSIAYQVLELLQEVPDDDICSAHNSRGIKPE